MLGPLAGGGDNGRIDQGPRFYPDRPYLELGGDRVEKALSSPCATSALRKRTKAVRSGVGARAENPQNRWNDPQSSSASASLTSDRSCQTESSSALNSARGGQAGSPLAAFEIPASACSTGAQSISLARSSNNEPMRLRTSPKPKLS
jgi:hypothetical protein